MQPSQEWPKTRVRVYKHFSGQRVALASVLYLGLIEVLLKYLHILLSSYDGLHVSLVDHSRQTLHEHFWCRVVLETFYRKVTLRRVICHYQYLFIIFWEISFKQSIRTVSLTEELNV